MNIFITGATGYIGGAVAARMQSDGHRVTGLARSEGAAARLEAAGYAVLRGDLSDLDVLAQGARAADAVISLAQPAFDPRGDFAAQMDETGRVTLAAIGAIVEAVDGTGKTVIFTGGTGAYGDTGDQVATEASPTAAVPFMRPLAEAEQRVLTTPGVRGISIRPGIVYGRANGPITQLIGMAKMMGAVFTSGHDAGELSFVHIDDLAALYALALNHAPAGTILNGVAEPFVRQKALMEAISQCVGLGGVVTPMSPEMAASMGGGSIFSRNSRVSGAKARSLGWTPAQPDVLTVIARGEYG